MAVEIAGFAQALARCLHFSSAEPAEIESVLSAAAEPLQMSYAAPSADTPLIRSGAPFTHMVFVQNGTVVPWQYPHSELAAPFLIGEHEFLAGAQRWVGSYSAVTETIVVGIPVSVMAAIVDRVPGVRDWMHQLLMRRLARFYWTSLATTGSTASRVAAALVSRLALEDEDHGEDRSILIRQKDLVRLTTLSRSAVADGLSELVQSGTIVFGGDRGMRFMGVVLVPDVDILKDQAFTEVRNREVRPLLASEDEE